MSLHINRFIDLIKAAESRGQRDITMPVRDAKDLHGDITKLLLALQGMREQQEKTAQVVEITMDGGSFKSPS